MIPLLGKLGQFLELGQFSVEKTLFVCELLLGLSNPLHVRINSLKLFNGVILA